MSDAGGGRATCTVSELHPLDSQMELPHLPDVGVSRIWELLTQIQYGSESQENE